MILVTGGLSGIGAAIVSHLRHTQSDRVLTLGRSPSDSSDHYQCDVSSYTELKAVYSVLSSKSTRLSALINCAGIASMNLALTTPADVTHRIISTNLLGTIYSTQVFAPLLIRNKSGRIINFSTIAVKIGLAGESVYVASKAGVEAFSRTIANELAPFNITVNCLAPGPINTPLLSGLNESQIARVVSHQIIKKQFTAHDISNLVSMILSSQSSSITGHTFNIGGF